MEYPTLRDDLLIDVDVDERVARRLRTLDALDATIGPRARVLDLGCGGGDSVSSLLSRGLDAYGCDLRFRAGRNRKTLEDEGRLRLIHGSPYRLPFDDDTFDAVLSDQVMEHVQDYESTLAEIARVSRPGAIGLHVFPPRWAPREVHVHVPLGGVIRARPWLWIWAVAGVRNVHQRELSVAEVVAHNRRYLSENVNYLGRRALRRAFDPHFTKTRFVEHAFLAATSRGGDLLSRPGARWIAPWLYAHFAMRAVLTRA